jgi:hypothetical protein
MFFNTIGLGAPAAPGNNETVTLFDSRVSFKGGLRMAGITRVIVSFPGIDQASATSGLKAFKWDGTAYQDATFNVLPATVPADTGSDSESYSLLVMGERDVKITYTAGATGPTAATWNPQITAVAGNAEAGTP